MENSFVQQQHAQRHLRLLQLLAAFGPGLMVMLADTDAGSIITAAQSGAQWGYAMILPQIILIPILFFIQEVTIRLGLATGKGHGEAIREVFGKKWAFVSVITMFIASLGALVTEFAGISGVGALFGVPPWLSVSLATIILIAIGITGSYKRFEIIGIAIGLLELFFIVSAFAAHPNPAEIAKGIATVPFTNTNYLFLIGSNIGAVIMPWMIFYQQGAYVDKGLSKEHLKGARWDTAIGSVLTQVIMIIVVIAVGATIYKAHPGQSLNTIQDVAGALEPILGTFGAKIAFSIGMLGASIIAALVVSIAASWGIGEVFGFKKSLNNSFKEAKAFYLIFTAAHIIGALLVIFSINLVSLTIDVEVLNAVLLPIVLGFLLALEVKHLPEEWKMKGWHRWLTWGSSGVVIMFGLYMAVIAMGI